MRPVKYNVCQKLESFNQEAKIGLEMLAKAGMKKINFSGGEPFIIKSVSAPLSLTSTGDNVVLQGREVPGGDGEALQGAA